MSVFWAGQVRFSDITPAANRVIVTLRSQSWREQPLGYNAEIVGDENQRHAGLLLQRPI